MILIIGSTGYIGSEVVRLLSQAGVSARALARNPDKVQKLPGITPVTGDLAKPETLPAAFADCTKLFLLTGNVENATELQHNAIAAARQAGVAHIAKLSAFGASSHSNSLIGRWHYQIEKELQESGKASNIDGVTLEDEGVAGERIDAELELTIVIEPATSYEIGSSRAPQVAAGVNGPTWTVTTPPNVFREGADATRRDRFRAAETRLVFADSASKPSVDRRGDRDVFAVTVPSSPTAFVVVLRGNEELLAQVIGKADWTKLRRTTP